VNLKALWASVQEDPITMRKLNGWATVLWVVMIPVSLFFGWLSSVEYVSALSLWALVSGHLSAWQAARVECKQDEQADE
jgi:general stress protein CsbA